MNPIKLTYNFLLEQAKWNKAGRPYRTEEKVLALFNICSSCEQYQKENEEKGKCGVCGCNLSNKVEFFNKLAWSTTKCPLENPLWIEEEEYRDIQVTEEEINAEQEMEQVPEPEPAPKPERTKGCGCG